MLLLLKITCAALTRIAYICLWVFVIVNFRIGKPQVKARTIIFKSAYPLFHLTINE